jgi:hypothetical protein
MRGPILCALGSLAVALAACSAPAPPPDAGDAGPPDAPPGDGAPLGDVPGVDGPPIDSAAGDVTTDAAELPDAVSESGPDASSGDASTDASADAPATFPSLTTEYPGTTFQVLFAPCSSGGCGGEVSVVMAPTSCMVTRASRRVNFSMRACGARPGDSCAMLSGQGATDTGGPPATVFVGAMSTLTVAVAAGARYFAGATPRQSFHVQFASPTIATGIAGRTVAPDRGDIWLLGCPTD